MSEYRPTEYVVDFGDCRSNQFVRLNMALIKQNGAKLHERIVRCHDCKFYQPKEGAMLSCKFEYHGFTQWKLAEPDGFCAWASRKEVGE